MPPPFCTVLVRTMLVAAVAEAAAALVQKCQIHSLVQSYGVNSESSAADVMSVFIQSQTTLHDNIALKS